MSNIGKKDIISREIDQAEKDALLEKYKTAMKKVQFIQELKTGLGKEIKENPSKFTVIKKTWFQKIMLRLKKIFTTF